MNVGDFDYPDDLSYTKTNLWVKVKDDSARIGLTSLAASLAKEIVHIDLPDDGQSFKSGEKTASYETIKSVNEIAAPFDCTVEKVNEELLDTPSLINTDPYGDGWVMEVKISGKKEALMGIKEASKHYKEKLDREKERYAGIYD